MEAAKKVDAHAIGAVAVGKFDGMALPAFPSALWQRNQLRDLRIGRRGSSEQRRFNFLDIEIRRCGRLRARRNISVAPSHLALSTFSQHIDVTMNNDVVPEISQAAR